jgi:hypothetical protein
MEFGDIGNATWAVHGTLVVHAITLLWLENTRYTSAHAWLMQVLLLSMTGMPLKLEVRKQSVLVDQVGNITDS